VLAVFLVLRRIVWGVAGTRWARFRSLDLRPSSLGRYLREALGPGEGGRHPGHNPATSWFVVATIAIILALGWTGFTMARGSEAAEEVHEILAWSMLALVAVHVGGVLWHRVRRGENLAAGMVTGLKEAPEASAIRSVRPWSAAALILLTAGWGAVLAAGYDSASSRLTLPLLGGPLQVGEREDDRGEDREDPRNPSTRESGEDHDRHDDEDD
ncbi:MAG TPA: cytochrome b/b6 domain-containing protein, partial [Thermoanaerobaculia bacterium]